VQHYFLVLPAEEGCRRPEGRIVRLQRDTRRFQHRQLLAIVVVVVMLMRVMMLHHAMVLLPHEVPEAIQVLSHLVSIDLLFNLLLGLIVVLALPEINQGIFG
jgi:hypothetical protein